MRYCQPINISISPLIESFNFPQPISSSYCHWNYDSNILNPQLIEYLLTFDLSVRTVLILYTSPGYSIPYIHIDGSEESDYTAMNWIFGGEGSTMHWYKAKTAVLPSKTPNGASVLHIDQQQAIELYRTHIQSPSIVSIGVFHSVNNRAATSPRYCLSIRFNGVATIQYMTNKFKDILL